MTKFICPSRAGPVFRQDPAQFTTDRYGHCKRYRATGPHRAGVDVDVTPPTGGPVGHPPPNPATLCD